MKPIQSSIFQDASGFLVSAWGQSKAEQQPVAPLQSKRLQLHLISNQELFEPMLFKANCVPISSLLPAATLHSHWDSTTVCRGRGQNVAKATPRLKINLVSPLTWWGRTLCGPAGLHKQFYQHTAGTVRRWEQKKG